VNAYLQSHPEHVFAGAVAVWAIGTLVLGIVWLVVRVVQTLVERADRQKRARRIAVALREEIRLTRKGLDAFLPAFQALPERLAADPTRPIFVLVDRQSQKIFEALRAELPELPSSAVIAAIRFYNMDSRITMVLDALAAPAFAAMPLEKKQEMLEGHAGLLESAVDAAREAEKMLTAVASPGRGAAAAARPRS
jgi:hypothetical protein